MSQTLKALQLICLLQKWENKWEKRLKPKEKAIRTDLKEIGI